MGNLRFFGLAAGMFVAVYFGMHWLLTVRPLQPDARLPTFHHVDTNDPRYKLEQTAVSDDDPTRDRLRHELLDDAKYLADDPCNDMLKRSYIKAANDYAHAWLSIAPCEANHTCRGSDSPAMDRAAQAFGSPLDLRVREAMQKVHSKRIFKLGDFPNDTALLIANLARDGTINPLADDNRPHRGPINAQTDTRPHPSMAELRVQLGETAPLPACGG